MNSNNRASEPDRDYVLELQIGFLLRRAHQHASSVFSQLIPVDNLTPPQFSVLLKVEELGHVSQNQLGRLVDIDRATVQGIVTRLEQRGLVIRTDDPSHKSRLQVSLSKTGKVLLDACLQTAPLISKQTLAPLTLSEQLQLLKLLDKLISQ